MKTQSQNKPDPHFKSFVSSLETIIDGHGNDNNTARQKGQIERLVSLEKEFRRTLIRHHWGKNVYRDFVVYITEEINNINDARPYFRERNTAYKGYYTTNAAGKKTYIKGIGDMLRDRNYRGLYRFNFNYKFIAFVMKSRKWRKGSRISQLHDEIVALRNELVEMNMPLAISQARMFWAKMQKSHLTYMDFIQIATEGLIAAIDKFCLPYRTVFRTVATHRMKGNFIDTYSETPIHFFPKDKRRLYQAYKFIRDQKGREFSYEVLVKTINKNLKPNERTTVEEITKLLGASSVVSANSMPSSEPVDEDDRPSVLDRFEGPENNRPDTSFEDAEAKHLLGKAIESLPLFDRKLLMMKGIV